MSALRVIDSHTGGEPTRLVIEGGPDLGDGPLAVRVQRFREAFDEFRSALVNEPRGSDPLVGALLVPPDRPDCRLGVIFFNNVGYLGMCGHGTIGLVASLHFAGELQPGTLRIDTPVGAVQAELAPDGRVTVENIVSYRAARQVTVEVPSVGPVTGDVAWGGNWFFLVSDHGQRIELQDIESLTAYTAAVRAAVNAQGYPRVDHVELFAASATPGVNSRNFVLCPGKAYDRSPCGTGTSAKLACLAADGKLAEGAPWVQESVVGSTFTGRFRWHDRARGEVRPSITGIAYVTGESRLHLDPADPFRHGIRA